MDYKEKLKDPRWLKRSKEIKERDNHKCMICGVDTTRLNVHHLSYRKGAEPWEYEDSELATLCEDCHKMVHDNGLHLEVRRSKISDRYMLCYGTDDKYGIQSGTVMASDMMELIFVCADKPYIAPQVVHYADGSRVDPMKYPLSVNVETQISCHMDGSALAFNEYNLPIDGPMSIEHRPATDEEKKILVKALKDWMNL